MKPILFNTEMVRALLDGRKTVTRRLVKLPKGLTPEADGRIFWSGACGDGGIFVDMREAVEYLQLSPYQPGDILWVRETWGNYSYDDESSHSIEFFYRADYPKDATGYWFEPEHINFCDFPRWRPSIHMPREAARLFLRVTAVRVERLQEITVEDCMAEGIWDDYKTKDRQYHDDLMKIAYPKCFAELWDSTVKPDDLPRYGWAADPWVWVIAFERISKDEALKGVNHG